MTLHLAAQDVPPRPDIRVTLSRAVPRGSPENPLFDVRLSYAFEKRSNVWLQGIGRIPATGELELTLRTDRLVFQDTRKGATLASVHVKPTEIQQTPPTDSPYAPTVQGAGWQQDGAPVVAAVPIEQSWNFIERNLQETYRKYVGPTPCRVDDSGCLLTQWTSITPRSETVQVQMAVMIIFTGVGANKTALKVYYLGRQALIGEKLSWDTSLDEKSRASIAARLAVLRVGFSHKETK